MEIMFQDSDNPAFRYEGLMRKIFNDCAKYGDYWGAAAQDFYINYSPIPSLKGKRALSRALLKVIFENMLDSKKLIELEERVWNAKEQIDIDNIVYEVIEIYNKSHELE